MEILPNNLADWPPSKPLRDTDSASMGMLGRFASRLVLLIALGGLLGFAAYGWAVRTDQLPLPPIPSLTTPAQDEPASTSADDPASTPTAASAPAPALDVTGLLGNQARSQNWAGYAATEGSYTGVSATWTIPDVALSSPAGMDAAWVGIGGVRSRDLIQAGTQRTVLGNGTTEQEAWLELLPRASETVPLTVGPGDTIRVSIDQQGPETWLIAFANMSSGQTYQVTRRYASSLSSAEWVEEAPSAGRRARTLPLDDFGTIRFSQASAVRDGQALSISQSGAHAITMITPGGVPLAEPSRLGADGGGFSVTRTSTLSPRRGP
jgi:hypothetical protein